MLAILVITVPIYLIIGLGFAAGYAGVFEAQDTRALGKFVVKFALPALLFRALSQPSLIDVFDARYIAAYGGGSLIVLLAVYGYARYARQRDTGYSALVAVGMSFSNSGFVGYPIVLQWLGPIAGVALALCMIVENLVMLPLTLALAESGGAHGDTWHDAIRKSLARILVNPMILAIIAGFAVALSGIALPVAVAKTIDLLANAATACALFVIGGTLVGAGSKATLREATLVAVGKLVLHPLVVFALLYVVAPADPRMRAAAVAYAAAPMLSIYPILAHAYGNERLCAAALLIATLGSFVTVTFVLWALSALIGGIG